MAHSGGSFLIEQHPAAELFTPEKLTAEHRATGKSARDFFEREVLPIVEAMQRGEHDPAVAALRKAASLGFEAVLTPERYGGMEMDLASAMVVAEEFARDGSFAGWHGAHAGIGTLPLLLFGTDAQKEKYLPKLSSGEMVAAYCLTEPHCGSDALAAKTRADRSPDGSHYVLNGQKAWITNGGSADLFTVFAKVDGEQFSAFLVERAMPGVKSGAEEHKMGLKGSSTTAVFFDNVKVPAENLLGEVGRGHIIAFNILNLGRLKLGPFAIGGAKEVLRLSIGYARERKAFGVEIGSFGMIRHKLAEMAIRIYAIESISYRTVGLVQGHLDGFAWDQPGAALRMMKAVEEFAAECSIVKVAGSEMLDYVVDEGVQIHGGFGYHQDYAVERAYRDSRINRIFEGTNEINRLLTTGMLLKRAQQGRLGLVKAAKALMDEVLGGSADVQVSEEQALVGNAKKTALLLLASAFEKFGAAISDQQQVMAGIADVVSDVYLMESVLLRSGGAGDLCTIYLRDGMTRIEGYARPVLAACADGDALRAKMTILRRFAKHLPVDSIAARDRIAARLLNAGRYVV